MSFDSAPFGVAMASVSADTGAAIVWGTDCDDTMISGSFNGANLYNFLLAIAKRYNFQLSKIGDIYFLGAGNPSDLVSCVVRSPSSDFTTKEAMLTVLSEYGKISQVGSCLVISDYMVNVKKFVDMCERLKNQNSRGYVCELTFLKMKKSDFIQLQASIDAQKINLFTSFNLETLFNAYLSLGIDGKCVNVWSRPILYLCEGRKALLEVGSEIQKSTSSVSSEGYSTVTGYKSFTDGVSVELTPYRVNTDIVAVDVSLTVSTFENESDDVDSVPTSAKSALISPGVLMSLGKVQFLGSLETNEKKRSFMLLGGARESNEEVLTVWGKISEIKL